MTLLLLLLLAFTNHFGYCSTTRWNVATSRRYHHHHRRRRSYHHPPSRLGVLEVMMVVSFLLCSLSWSQQQEGGGGGGGMVMAKKAIKYPACPDNSGSDGWNGYDSSNNENMNVSSSSSSSSSWTMTIYNTDDGYRPSYWSASDSYLPNCDEASENPRGRYTTHLAPCVFAFHHIPDDNNEEQEGENDEDGQGDNNQDQYSFGGGGGVYHLTNTCTASNKIGFVKAQSTNLTNVEEYVNRWGDECVGDFVRCYSIFHHQEIYFDFMCRKHWKIPEGATHMSVDCTEDKQLKLAKQNYFNTINPNKKTTTTTLHKNHNHKNRSKTAWEVANEKNEQRETRRFRRMEAFVVLILLLLLLCCFFFSFFTYKCFIKPYLATSTRAAKRSRVKQFVTETKHRYESLKVPTELAE